jgi:hypothetical protein
LSDETTNNIEITEAAWQALNTWNIEVNGEGIPESRTIAAELAAMLEVYRQPHQTISDVIITLFARIVDEPHN